MSNNTSPLNEIKTLDDFLKLPRPEIYDFSNDCITEESYQEKTGLDKFFAYKTSPNKGKDPDTNSALLQHIYSQLWGDLTTKEFMFRDNWIASDTMTSAWVPVKKYITLNFESELKQLKQDKGYRFDTVKVFNELYENKSIKEAMAPNKSLVKFVSMYHSIGNYCPVPIGFNVPRSGWGASYDSWDLTLMKIKQFYLGLGERKAEIPEHTMHILELMHYDKSVINVYKWLEHFGQGIKGWKNFINTMYFNDYIKEEGDDYIVLPLCNNHNWDNIEINDYNEFFENAADRIEKRGKIIVNELRKKL